jgi:hypothetical protein
MENNKKQLRIYFANNIVDNNIVKFLERKYEILVRKKKSEEIDLIIFSGGEDVSPEYYRDKKGKHTVCNSNRDEIEYGTFNDLIFLPKLGICRGAQFLTVMSNGKLIQHVENHKNSTHSIRMHNGKLLIIPSDHHQMMYPFDMDDKKYELLGWSETFLSSVYLNGNNENINISEKFLEPEIIYYKNTNSLAIQPHPEWEIGSKHSDYLLDLIDNKLFNNNVEEKIEKIPFNDFMYETEPSSMLIENDYNTYAKSLADETMKKINQMKYGSFDPSELINALNKR